LQGPGRPAPGPPTRVASGPMRTRARATICSLLAAAALAVPAGAAGSVTWVVHGGGFGHGVGISAYGAYGFGLHGYGYRQILHHYFRGIRITALSRAPIVRVLLSTAPGDVGFAGATAACGAALDPRRSYLAHRRGASVRLLSSSGKLLARCGAKLHASGRGPLRIRGLGTYRGALEAVPTASGSGSLNVVNALDVNSYVRGSVPAEVPPEWPAATLKTFAVASRSIALSTDVGGDGFSLYSDTRTQNYGGVAVESARTDRAVRATRDQVVTYHGEIAQTTYFSASGGRTESHFLGAPAAPYDESVADPYDYYSPLHRWTFRFSQAEIDAKLGAFVEGRLRRIAVTRRGRSGRIDYAKLVGTRGTTTVRGDTLALALGLYDRLAYIRRVRG
jgi:SpoIID/LytB domain protein